MFAYDSLLARLSVCHFGHDSVRAEEVLVDGIREIDTPFRTDRRFIFHSCVHKKAIINLLRVVLVWVGRLRSLRRRWGSLNERSSALYVLILWGLVYRNGDGRVRVACSRRGGSCWGLGRLVIFTFVLQIFTNAKMLHFVVWGLSETFFHAFEEIEQIFDHILLVARGYWLTKIVDDGAKHITRTHILLIGVQQIGKQLLELTDHFLTGNSTLFLVKISGLIFWGLLLKLSLSWDGYRSVEDLVHDVWQEEDRLNKWVEIAGISHILESNRQSLFSRSLIERNWVIFETFLNSALNISVHRRTLRLYRSMSSLCRTILTLMNSNNIIAPLICILKILLCNSSLHLTNIFVSIWRLILRNIVIRCFLRIVMLSSRVLLRCDHFLRLTPTNGRLSLLWGSVLSLLFMLTLASRLVIASICVLTPTILANERCVDVCLLTWHHVGVCGVLWRSLIAILRGLRVGRDCVRKLSVEQVIRGGLLIVAVPGEHILDLLVWEGQPEFFDLIHHLANLLHLVLSFQIWIRVRGHNADIICVNVCFFFVSCLCIFSIFVDEKVGGWVGLGWI